jgi:hypothetical protein
LARKKHPASYNFATVKSQSGLPVEIQQLAPGIRLDVAYQPVKAENLEFLCTKKLTEFLNPVEYRFLYNERESFYEEFYGKEKRGRAEMAAY